MTSSPGSPVFFDAARHGLVDRDRSVLAVIDVQSYFLGKLPLDTREPLVARMAWLMRVARELSIPILATAEDVANDGPLVAELSSLLPDGAVVHDKMVFGLCGQPPILEELLGHGRDTVVLVGLETDVCIAQSALGLAERGLRPVVIEDATGSPPPNHDAGLRRLREAGITVTTVKGIFYEWVRDLATYHRVKAALNVPLPPGMTI
ncbi:MAG: isochorismatase family protein [Hyphomicrobiaceae bacterium]